MCCCEKGLTCPFVDDCVDINLLNTSVCSFNFLFLKVGLSPDLLCTYNSALLPNVFSYRRLKVL